jgi:Protein of unknown function (DUF2568)
MEADVPCVKGMIAKPTGGAMLKVFAAILALGVELAVLWACWIWGFRLPFSLPMRIAAGLALVAAVAAIWGALVAPRAKRRLPVLPRAIAKIAIFVGAALLAWHAQETILAGAIALAAAVSLTLEYVVRVPEMASPPQAQ